MMGTRDQAKLEEWAAAHPQGKLGSPDEAAAFGEALVLAVKGSAAGAVLRFIGAPLLNAKVVIDATNPISDVPPENGVMQFFTTLERSLMEELQQEHPEARFVKAFNSVGSIRMVNPQYAGGKPTMFICGNDAAAKQTVSGILSQFGWETADMGGVEAARVIEPLAILWCIPGFLRNEWTHAFKLLK
jgi:predicted dinucleotide-binding enzyme